MKSYFPFLYLNEFKRVNNMKISHFCHLGSFIFDFQLILDLFKNTLNGSVGHLLSRDVSSELCVY